MVPLMDGTVHHFGPRGLYNGLLLLGDDETGSHWDHITGECVHGPSKGKRMPVLPVRHVTAGEAAAEDPSLEVALSDMDESTREQTEGMIRLHEAAQLPPGFTDTMGEPDGRLPRMESGVGLVGRSGARFYPLEAIRRAGGHLRDEWEGRSITLKVKGGLPEVTAEAGEPPMYLFTRWYGFSYTYPGCKIYGEDARQS